MNTHSRKSSMNLARGRSAAESKTHARTTGRLVVSMAALFAVLGLGMVACGGDPGESEPEEEGSVLDPFATGGSGGGTGYLAVGGSGNHSLPEGCATDTYPGEVVPLDMHIMLDRSSSMLDGDPPKWGEITAAISSFMSIPASADLGIGMAIFPVARSKPAPVSCTTAADCHPFSNECNDGVCFDDDPTDATSCWAEDHSKPLVGLGPLSVVAPQINAAMAETQVMGYTPMAPALLGAIDYAKAWADKTPEHITTVVLATDGYPTKCAVQAIDDVAAIAEEAFVGKSLKTFVIGIGDGLENLNTIAKKGGTGAAIMVDSGNAGEEFLAALNSIRGSMTCTYKIPVPASGEADLDQLNVAITPHNGSQEILPRVGSEEECAGEAGYYLDDPSNPTQLTLCPASCERGATTNADVQVVIGCGAVIK
jgi:hypothetical protein